MAFKKPPLESLEYTSGDIVEDKAEVLVNTVNSRLSERGNPVMGAGVAKAFRDKWGDAVMKPYAEAIKSGELRPGRALLFDLPDGRKWAALATKDDWRDKSQMQWVESGLKELGEKLRDGGFKSVAITPPGCGNGGLDWKKVEPIVHRELEGVNVHMFAKPSGAMVNINAVEEMAEQKNNPANLAKERDSRIRKPLYGTVVDVPEASYTLSGHPHGRCSFQISMSVQEDGRGSKPVFFKSDEMDREQADKAIEEITSLKKGDKVTLAGGWVKSPRTQAWGFVAQRMGRGEIPLSGLKSTSPSPKVIGDPHFKDILAGSLEAEKAAANRAPKAAIEDDNTFRGKPIAEKGSMYFSYGWEARPDVKSQTTFDAILDGERTSTTRFDKWKGSERWGRLKRGDLVRFYEDREMKGKSVVVRVDSVERIDMRTLNDAQREDWSKAEGWSTLHANKSAERYGAGYQVRYHPVPGQDILKGRGAEKLAEQMEAAASEQESKRIMDALTGGRHSRMQRQGMMAALSNGIGG
tara:strand:- start:129 stop:1697 length:1569 start_codon:yes stop_codon:yes gene_type:complete